MFAPAAIVTNDHQADWVRLLVAAAALALLGWGYWLAHRGRPDAHQRLRDWLLLGLGAAAALGWLNFGSLHFGNFIHTWDTYHYYIGAKYFPELGYDRLYECTAIADAESGLREAVAQRKLTDLKSNLLVPAKDTLAHPERCKDHFNSARWEDFKRDVGFFRARLNPRKWEQVQHDHGYNATPVWTMLGRALSSLGPASTPLITFLCLMDLALILGAVALIGWAFGLRVLAVALIAFGTNYPNRFYWTGGAFLRYDWLFYTVAAVCFLKRERPFLAGLALAYATTLRLFPGFLIIGPAMAAAERLWRERTLDPRYLKLFAGAALGAVMLVGGSFAISGGIDTYGRFAQNTLKHANTPLTNHMGLRTAVSYRPDKVGRFTHDGKQTDPWAPWKDARLAAFRQAKPLFYALVLGALVLLFFAVRGGAAPWVAMAASATLIAVGSELTCYYYAFILAVAVLHHERREVGLLLVALTTLTHFIGIAPLPNMSGWEDEKYLSMSFASLIAFGGALWMLGKGTRYCLPAEPAFELTAGSPATDLEDRRALREKERQRTREKKRERRRQRSG